MNEMVPLGRMNTMPSVSKFGGAAAPLSRRAKAAIVVRLLLNDGADIPLEDLPEDLQALLTQQMGSMRTVDRDTLSAVVDEFAQELANVGLSFPGGIAGALTALDGKISRQTADRLRKEAGVRQLGDPWDRLRALDAQALLPMIENESIEVAAVVLSKLKVSLAAELLGLMPGPKARQITYAVSLTSNVTSEAVDHIGLSLASQLDSVRVSAFDNGPVERLGAILNSSTALIRDDMLSGLEETDQGFAKAVRKAIFTFANIPERITPRDILRVLRGADPAQIVIALAGAEAAGETEAMTFILDNMSKRMATQMREDIAETGRVKPADAEAAMASIVAVIRQMEADGELQLIQEDEEE